MPRRSTPAQPNPDASRTPVPEPAASDTALHAMQAQLQARLQDVEARVTALESGAGTAVRSAASEPSGAGFWLLESLDRRLPSHQGAVAYGGRLVDGGGRRLQWQITRLQDDLLAEDWADLAPRLAALGHPVRLQLLQALAQAPATVTELTALPGLGTAGQVYHHLRELDAAGWIAAAPQRGQWTLAPARAVPLLALIAATRA